MTTTKAKAEKADASDEDSSPVAAVPTADNPEVPDVRPDEVPGAPDAPEPDLRRLVPSDWTVSAVTFPVNARLDTVTVYADKAGNPPSYVLAGDVDGVIEAAARAGFPVHALEKETRS